MSQSRRASLVEASTSIRHIEDAYLERRIDAARRALERAEGHEAQSVAAQSLYALIAQRTPRQVERMERQRGLSG